jgi:hypothetical protein
MHVYRQTETGPKWACEVIEADTPDGYRVADADPLIADQAFMGDLTGQLGRPQNMVSSAKNGLSIVIVLPGEHGHVEAALRAVPGAVISKVGRS